MTQPDIVVVELCKSRINILSLDEETLLREAKNINLEKIRTAIRQVCYWYRYILGVEGAGLVPWWEVPWMLLLGFT